MLKEGAKMLSVLNYEELHPYVRCVGKSGHLKQSFFHMAYDHRMLVIGYGDGFIETEDGKYVTAKGELYLIPPGTRYRVVSEGEQEIYVFNFDMTHSHSRINEPVISVPEEMFDETGIIEAFDMSLFFEEKGIVKRKISHEGIDICPKILKLYKGTRAPEETILMNALFLQLLCFAFGKRDSECKNTLATDIFNYVNDNHKSDLSLENTAEHFHIHPTYLNRLLKKHYGTSFRQLLVKARFERAVYLMDNTELSIKEIAINVGFNDAQYFSYAFFKRFGFYPTVYRK